MEREIVEHWIDNLMNACGVKKLEDVPKCAIEYEIRQAEGDIKNQQMWDDKFGIICNETYIEMLKDALERCKK